MCARVCACARVCVWHGEALRALGAAVKGVTAGFLGVLALSSVRELRFV